MTTETSDPTPAAAPEASPAAPAPVLQTAVQIAPPVAGGPAWAVGRRKSSTARARLSPGEGKIRINGKKPDAYFPEPRECGAALAPMKAMGADTRYDAHIRVAGGGATGQAGAVSLALARALRKCEPNLAPELRKQGFVSRDARVKERKKYGRRGARRGFQFSKR